MSDNNFSPTGGPQMPSPHRITKVISGGQTGVDQAALRAAFDLDIPTGGMCPAGWRTEDGRNEALKLFNLVEAHTTRYEFRTFQNVKNSDGTLWIGPIGSSGFQATLNAAKGLRKPFFHALCHQGLKGKETVDELYLVRDWIRHKNIKILNVAGNRKSTNPTLATHAVETLTALFLLTNFNGEAGVVGGPDQIPDITVRGVVEDFKNDGNKVEITFKDEV